MERELAQQGQREHQGASAGTRNTTSTTSMPSSSVPVTPTPPRLTPNPTLLDSLPPMLTPTSSSSPPPLTPAPSLSASHVPKATAGAPSPHVLIPNPPKLTSTAVPALRTYSRPSPPGASKTTPASIPMCSPTSSLRPTMAPNLNPASSSSSSSSPAAVASAVPLPISPSSSVSHSNMASSAKTSTTLTNGNSRSIPTATSTPITPFHTPASPTGRQLQSLTLRPPAPGTHTVPPSLRLKPPSSATSIVSRPRNPLFPPLRPRPQPSASATEGPAMPTRHLAVPPPTLYSPMRAVPLRPRLQSPNGHRVVLPKPSSASPLATSPSSRSPPTNRHLAGLKACPLSQTPPPRSQSQHSSAPVSSPLTPAAAHFERSSSAARQLQIIALSSGHKPQPSKSAHTHGSVQSVAPAVDSPEPANQSQRTLTNEETRPLSLKPLLLSATSPLPSLPSLVSPSLPLGQAGLQEQPLIQRVENQGGPRKGEEHRATSLREETRDKGGKGEEGGDRKEEADMMMKKQHNEKQGPATEKGEAPGNLKEQRSETEVEEESMEVTEEGQVKSTEGEEEDEEEDEEETPMEQSGHPSSPKPTPGPVTKQESSLEPKPSTGLVPTQTPEPQRDLQLGTHEDLCENMSTQSDNQSALSSLSSQSPPSSPVTTPTPDNPPPLLPAQPAHPADLSLSQQEPDKFSPSQEEATHLDQADDEVEGPGRPQSEPWTPRIWPEGRQVLTHLVEGFVIQEGLLPFPVNRSSLLVQDQVSKPQEETNGTNGKEVLPLSEPLEQTDPVVQSTDSEEDEDEDGAGDNAGTRSSQRERAVLHCQFCGKRGHAHNFMRSKRFCSTSCARGFNVRLTKRLRALSAGRRSERPRPALNRAESVPGKPLLLRLPRDLWSAGRRERQKEDVDQGEEEMEGEAEEADEGGNEDPAVAVTTKVERRSARRPRRMSEPAVTTSTPTTTFRAGPTQWSVEEVTAFIHTLPGCSEVAEAFRLQEIDGQALLLLTEDHLMTSMNIKLGPALKICAHINALKNQ